MTPYPRLNWGDKGESGRSKNLKFGVTSFMDAFASASLHVLVPRDFVSKSFAGSHYLLLSSE